MGAEFEKFRGEMLIDGIQGIEKNWELGDKAHNLNDGKINIKDGEKELVVAYLEDKLDLSKNTTYKKNLLEKSVNGDFMKRTKKMLGIIGRTVKDLQKELNKRGYDVGGVDGIYGKKTLIALIKFQRKNGLDPGFVGLETADLLFFQKYKNMAREIAKKHNIPEKIFLNLLQGENPTFNPNAKVGGGNSAFGLGQMNNDTWKIYGEGLDINKPKHQLIASAKMLVDLKKYSGSYEIGTGLYNTGKNLANIKNVKSIHNYVKRNPKIRQVLVNNNKIHQIGKNLSLAKKTYLIAAVSFYSQISYKQALKIVNNGKVSFKKEMGFPI